MGLLNYLRDALVWERDKSGNMWMTLGGSDKAWTLGDPLDEVMSNPVLFGCVDLIARLTAKAEFRINGEEASNNPIIQRINNPNEFQSKQDFLNEFIFFKYAYGWVYQFPVSPIGMRREISAFYNLNPKNVHYNNTFPTRLIFEKSDIEATKEKQFKYKEATQERDFNITEVIPFFDIANGLSEDFLLKAPSRLKAVQKNIRNLNVALDSEFNALEKAGRWIVSSSGGKGQVIANRPLDSKDKEHIEGAFGSYGSGKMKGNVIATTGQVDAQSLHIPMNQLGIPESIASNALHVMNAFRIPKELYPLVAGTGAKYDNMEQAMVSLIQNVIQDNADDLANSYTSFFKNGETITAHLDHLPAMQVIEEMKADKALKLSTAIRNLTGSGIDVNAFLDSLGIEIDQVEPINTEE